ncbi:patatin-like phospholipase family protein [Variovorax paradoxus]|nr:patatin-like phospholipase family protein [Variovorax paradoxus]
MNKLKEQVVARRIALGRAKLPDNGSHLWGLALSGGGIRSATFCFGLLRAFARAKLLLRFDVLSTVSGGGYIGGMVGRLFSRASTRMDARKVQEALGEARANWFVWWLRANGRYLIPRGAKDTTFVIGLFLRNLVAVHFELALVALGLGALLAMVTLLAWQLVAWLGYYQPNYLFPFLQDLPDWALLWFPAVWLALPFVAAVGAAQAAAYWLVPWVSRRKGVLVGWSLVMASTVTLIAIYAFLNVGDSPVGQVLRTTLYRVTAALLLLWLLGVPIAKRYSDKADKGDLQAAEEARTNLTRALANSFRWFTVIALAGVIDRCAWFLAFELEPLTETGQGAAALWLAGAAAFVRAALPVASKLIPGRAGTGSILFVGRVLGYALTFLLCVWWVSLVHKAVLGAAFTNRGVSFVDSWATLVLLAVPLCGFILVSGRNVGFLNLSSLHAFYRARIVRSYLGAANGARFKETPAPLSALARRSSCCAPRRPPAQNGRGNRPGRRPSSGPVHSTTPWWPRPYLERLRQSDQRPARGPVQSGPPRIGDVCCFRRTPQGLSTRLGTVDRPRLSDARQLVGNIWRRLCSWAGNLNPGWLISSCHVRWRPIGVLVEQGYSDQLDYQ